MKNLVVVEEYAQFRPVRLPASPHAIPTRFTEQQLPLCGLVRSLPGTALAHWAPIRRLQGSLASIEPRSTQQPNPTKQPT